MKLNWGSGIAIFYSIFAIALVYLVVKSFSQDHSLVVDNYYEEDLKYQEHYEKLTNSKALEQDLTISHDMSLNSIRLQFPDDLGTISGTISFYRPSDKSKDVRLNIKTDQNYSQNLPVEDLITGNWTIKVDWKAGRKNFYKEETIIL